MIRGASPTISNNIISDNQACAGAGILMLQGGALIQSNDISGNSVELCGILIIGASRVTIRDNFISQSTSIVAVGIFVDANNLSVQIDQNVIVGNMASGGAGIAGWMTAARLVNNTIANNGQFHASASSWTV